MGILVYSLLWVVQDLHHQPYQGVQAGLEATTTEIPGKPSSARARIIFTGRLVEGSGSLRTK